MIPTEEEISKLVRSGKDITIVNGAYTMKLNSDLDGQILYQKEPTVYFTVRKHILDHSIIVLPETDEYGTPHISREVNELINILYALVEEKEVFEKEEYFAKLKIPEIDIGNNDKLKMYWNCTDVTTVYLYYYCHTDNDETFLGSIFIDPADDQIYVDFHKNVTDLYLDKKFFTSINEVIDIIDQIRKEKQ